MKQNTYNTVTKAEARKLNQKQTALVETITSQVEKTDGSKVEKVEVNIYLNNSSRRSEAYYNMYEGNFKPSKKDGVQKSYRLLKLHKAFEEIGEKGAKEGIKFFKAEDYAADAAKEVKTETEAPAEERTESEAPVTEE